MWAIRMGCYRMHRSSPSIPSTGNRIAEAWGCEGAWRAFRRASSWGSWCTGNRQGVLGDKVGEERVHNAGLGNLDLMLWGMGSHGGSYTGETQVEVLLS